MNLIVEFVNNICSSSEGSELERRIQLDESTYGDKTATNANFNAFALLDLNIDATLAKSVNAFGLTEEHDLHFVSFRISIDKLGQSSINLIKLVRYVDQETVLKLLILLDKLDNFFISDTNLLLGLRVQSVKLRS